MSLYSAVYTDRDVPYQDPGYYSDITEPSGFLPLRSILASMHSVGWA